MTLTKLSILNILLLTVLIHFTYNGYDAVAFNAWLTIEKGLIVAFSIILVSCVLFIVKGE